MNKFLAGLLVAATAMTPLTAAYAQRDGRDDRRVESRERAPRGPEIRQWNRGDRQAPAPDAREQSERPRGEWRQQQRGEWRGNGSTDTARAPRSDTQQPDRQRQDWGNRGGVYDRNRDGNLDRRWDRNRDGNADRNWDRNSNGRVDRQWDRNRDGNLDRRWDQNRDGRVDRYRHDDRRYGNSGWNRGWRNDRRYNWHGYREQYRDHYRLGRYYAPYRDHRYSRFSIGIRIGSPFYSNRYWINDPWRYRLPDVEGPYRWVRYYDDVLLVDIYSGQVVDVIHDFFW